MTTFRKASCILMVFMCIAVYAESKKRTFIFSMEQFQHICGCDTKEALIAIVGPPSYIVHDGKEEIWEYSSYGEDFSSNGIDGFTVTVTADGKLKMWNPSGTMWTKSETIGYSLPLDDKAPFLLAEPMTFCVTTEGVVPGMIFIDHPGVNTSYSASESAFIITNVLQIARCQERTTRKRDGRVEAPVDSPIISVTLTHDDAPRFLEFTKRFLGRMLLLKWGTNTMCVLRVTLPVSGFSIHVTTNNSDAIESHFLRQATAYPVREKDDTPASNTPGDSVTRKPTDF